MTTPALVPITPAGAWQKVATDIKTGVFKIKDSGPDAYYHTYVDTGDAAPVTVPIGNIFFDKVKLNNSVGVDFYIYAVGAVGVIETRI